MMMMMETGKGGGGGGGGEVRRVNVVYFLSRGGRVEHPHLIRVRHLHRAGVRLRDVKRWLAELRGKDMADSFAWSYKRRYRSGYVWQDLTDEDLITPICDNEYVLKGSELIIPHRPTTAINAQQASPSPLIGEKSWRAAAAEEDEKKETEEEAAAAVAERLRPNPNPNPNPNPAETVWIGTEGDEVLSPNPTPPPPPRDSSDEPAARRRSVVFKIDACEAEAAERAKEKERKAQQLQEVKEEERGERMAGEESQSQSQSRSLRRASHALRSILTCRAVDTNDAALRPVSRRERSTGDAGGGGGLQLAARRPTNSESQQYASWQCGKSFNPEKLHSHMKSCKALKARGKGYTNL